MRVVVDTNIYISAVMFGGLPGSLLELGLRGVFQLVVSETLLDELEEKLRGKFEVTVEDAAAIRARLKDASLVVSPVATLYVVAEDPDDNRVLECAIAGQADAVVSGDRHLLRIREYGQIPILTAREFLDMMGWRE